MGKQAMHTAGVLAEALTLHRSLNDRHGLALVAAASGVGSRALTMAGGAAARREALGLATTPLARDILESKLSRARLQLSAEEAAAAWSRGFTMSQDEIVAEALHPATTRPFSQPALRIPAQLSCRRNKHAAGLVSMLKKA